MIEGGLPALEAGLRCLKIRGPATVAAKLIEFAEMVLAENKHTNLTGARDLESIVREHLLDSLAPLKLAHLAMPIVDVGSGAGFPGIPAAVAYPEKRFILLEPRAKRAAFLKYVAERLELDNVKVEKSAALGARAASITGLAGTVLMRAVAEPGAAFALGLPLLRRGGQLLLYEGKADHASPEQARSAKRARGGKIYIKQVVVPGLNALRHVWIVRKV